MIMTENIDADDAECTESNSSTFVPLVAGEERRPRRDTVPRPPCDACEINHHDGLHDVSLGDDEYNVCEHCFELLEDVLTRYDWWERLTEAHYDRASEYLHSLDEVWCVKDNTYAGGEMWIHTPFCDAAVVNDVCTHFGFHIRWFSVVSPDDPGFDCVHNHGPCIEINLVYNNWVTGPRPLEYDIIDDVTYHDVAWLEDHHKLFNRDD
jgi:hypothetical protein